DEVKEVFGLHDLIVLGIVREEGVFRPETLERVARITEGILDLEGVIEDDLLAPTEVDDIFTTADGILRVDTLMDEVPESPEEARRILAQIGKNPVLRGKLASDDGKTMAVFIPLESKDRAREVAAGIRELIAAEGGDEEYHLAGIPLAEDTFGAEMFIQMAVSAPAAMLLIFLLMLYFFRKPMIIAAPMIVAMMSVIWTMGLLIGLGFTVHIMSSMIPIFLMPIAVLDSIHMITEFHERYPSSRSMRQTISDTMDELFVPMIFTSLTTVVGFVSLILTPIPPVQVFGAFVAFGIAVAWFLSMTFAVSFAALIPEKRLKNFGELPESRDWMRHAMHAVRRVSTSRAKPIVAVGALLFVVALVGLTRIEVNDNPVKWFKPGHSLRVADAVLNEHLAGTYMAYLSVESEEDGGFTNPDALRFVQNLQAHLGEHPNVGGTTSIADIVEKVRLEMTGERAAGIPDTREEIAQYLFLYEISGGDPDDLFKFITPESDRTVVWVQMRRGENREVASVLAAADEFLSANPHPGLTTHWAGLPYINVIWQQKMVAGMGKALAGSFAIVLVMMSLLFRSIRIGILSMIPLTATIAAVYGFIGFAGKPYDMPIAVLSSLTLGLSIDFAIHFLQRAREILRETGDLAETMRQLFEAPSHAIARNILVIALGFVPMFFSNLVPYITVSAFFFAIMVVSGATTMFSLPAIISLTGGRVLGVGQRKGRSV
ncbi:MAG: MMPL family transporter, partial [Gemmatimonadota bacterium]|nr:MMPL family transporter [Gemmatimonadota bacterium]